MTSAFDNYVDTIYLVIFKGSGSMSFYRNI